MAVRYFLCSNCGRPFEYLGKTFAFTPCGVAAGRISGYYVAEDQGEQAILDQASKSRVGISELTEEDFRLVKKTANPTNSSSFSLGLPRLVEQAPQLSVVQNHVAGFAGSTGVQGSTPPDDLPTVNSLIHTGPVAPPQPLIREQDRMQTNWTGQPDPKPANIKIRHIQGVRKT